MKIQITFFKDDDMLEPIVADVANDVLDAEGKLAMMARQVQQQTKVEVNEKVPF